MNTSRMASFTLFKRWLRVSSILFAAVAACMMFGTTTLRAGCGAPGNHLMGSLFKPAAFATPGIGEPGSDSGHASVVGFWHALLLVDGNPETPLFQSIVQYHADGLEAESADQSSINPGNYCMGVWKQEGDTVEIYHIAWLFQNGNTAGYAVITQKNTLSHDGNSYTGTFRFKQYDNSGTLVMSLKGTTSAQRIDFHHPFSLF